MTDTGFYTPMPDGIRFVNSETGDVHVCMSMCDRKIEIDDRFVCPLTHVVIGSVSYARPVTKKRVRDAVDTARTKMETERVNRRRLGHDVLNKVFHDVDVATDEVKVSCVDLAMRVYDWLGEKISFDAVTYATMMCLAEGVNTSALKIPRDDLYTTHVRPLRYVKKMGIKQSAVTRAYTAMMNKRGDVLSM